MAHWPLLLCWLLLCAFVGAIAGLIVKYAVAGMWADAICGLPLAGWFLFHVVAYHPWRREVSAT
jgi:hypothetical protein